MAVRGTCADLQIVVGVGNGCSRIAGRLVASEPNPGGHRPVVVDAPSCQSRRLRVAQRRHEYLQLGDAFETPHCFCGGDQVIRRVRGHDRIGRGLCIKDGLSVSGCWQHRTERRCDYQHGQQPPCGSAGWVASGCLRKVRVLVTHFDLLSSCRLGRDGPPRAFLCGHLTKRSVSTVTCARERAFAERRDPSYGA